MIEVMYKSLANIFFLPTEDEIALALKLLVKECFKASFQVELKGVSLE